MEAGMRNPHQDRNPFKSFTGGFQQGWRDRRPPAIPLPKDTMERGGSPAIPLPKATWQTKPPWQGDAPWLTGGPLAGFDRGNTRPIYDKNGRLIQQRPFLGDKQSHIPIPIMDYVGNRTAMNRGLDNWGGYLGGTFDQEGYGDPSWSNRWGGYYTPDNFDPYDDDVLDPGGGEHSYGPLFLG